MIGKNISSRIYPIVRNAAMAMLVPVILIYILLNKPDYHLMNASRAVVVPVARFVGDVVTWPLRAVGKLAQNIREYSLIAQENKELRAKLDALLRDKNACDVLIDENERLAKILDMAQTVPQKTIIARVIHSKSALHHGNFIIDKGDDDGVSGGMAVISTDGFLVGIVTDVTRASANIRSLSDSKSNIPVRASGTDVYGFLRGMGRDGAVFEFFSDPEFKPTVGIKLLSSGIKGNMPNGIPVGTVGHVSKSLAAQVGLGAHPDKIVEVMVLVFDQQERYK